MIQSPPRTILDVFESLPEGTLAEIIENNLIMSPAPDFWHQATAYNLARLLGNYVEEKGLGICLGAPVDVYFTTENVYQPDVLFLSNERMHLVQQGKIKGAPDLIIEVLSPGTEKHDKKVKKKVYEQAGVKEYWIVDPSSKKVWGYQLANQAYTEIPSENGVIASPLLGLTVRF